MNIEVRYYSKSGNTKKIAEAIASQAGAAAKPICEPVQGQTDILFLGTGVYAFDIDPQLKEYILTLNPAHIKKVVVFSTAAIVKSAYEKTKKYLLNQGLSVSDEEYHCPGHYRILRKGRPDAEDIKQAGQFAKALISSLQSGSGSADRRNRKG